MSTLVVWLSLPTVVLLIAALALVARRLHTTRERLDRMESRLAAVLEGSDAGLTVWDPPGRLMACNKRFREFYPTVELKPGLVFEDLTRFTATRSLIQLGEDEVERWIEARMAGFGTVEHNVHRTPDGRWLEIDTRPTGAGEILLLYTDTTSLRETETTLSDSSARLERQSADLALMADAIRIGSTATDPKTATAAMVALVCEWAGWPVGYAYTVSAHAGEVVGLDPIPAWFADTDVSSTFEGLRTLIEQRHLKRGDGIAGRVLHTGQPLWSPNVAVDPSIDPELLSAMIGIRGVCAVPVKHDDVVVAVLEFLARDQLVPDPSTTRLLEAVAGTLAWVFRTRADT